MSTTAPDAPIIEVRPLLFSLADAGAMLGGVGRTTIYAEVKAGRLRTVKIANRTFISLAELERYVEAASA